MTDSERIRNQDIQEALDSLFPIDFTEKTVLPKEQKYCLISFDGCDICVDEESEAPGVGDN